MRVCKQRRKTPTLGDLVVAVTDLALEIADDEHQAYKIASTAINDYLKRSQTAHGKRRKTTRFPGLSILSGGARVHPYTRTA